MKAWQLQFTSTASTQGSECGLWDRQVYCKYALQSQSWDKQEAEDQPPVNRKFLGPELPKGVTLNTS